MSCANCGALGVACVECGYGVGHWRAIVPTAYRDVEVGHAGWEIPGPQRSFAVRSAILMVRPKTLRLQRANRRDQSLSAGRPQDRGVAAKWRSGPCANSTLSPRRWPRRASRLRGARIRTPRASPTPCFPNNWVSFHADGTVVLYPMHAENRRAERRTEIIDAVVRETGFEVRRVLDLTRHEKAGRFLEGTGSLVLDHRGARGLRLPFAAHRRGGGARMGARDGL